MHRHDYAEVLWIEAEQGLHLVNGHRLPLAPGDLVLIRPRDAHDLRATHQAGLTLVNISFSADTLAFLQRRYFPRERSFWGGQAELPARFHLTPDRRKQISLAADALAAETRTRLNLERFLLNLLHILAVEQCQPELAQGLPWLRAALEQIRRPEHFAGGAAELVRLAGKTPEHVARATRRLLGRTPTMLVNEARLNHAAGQLSMTTRPVLDICLECGFNSLAHFYKIFGARFHISPRRYRLLGQFPA